MPPVILVSNREEDSMNNEPSLSGRPLIGIIYPPPDIRNIVDKTAAFVARNGVEFENKIREKELNNSRFSFLSVTDPYNSYYQHKVNEFREGAMAEPAATRPQIPEAVKEHVKQAEFIPKDPPTPFEFDANPATINAFDLDLIKLTALLVARNGRQFLAALTNRESRNFMFDFLKAQHSNFNYFSKLVDQYAKVIVPASGFLEELKLEEENTSALLDSIRYRVGWEKYQRAQREKEDAELERERCAYAQIDWHDFVVVQTVDFPANDNTTLPPFCSPKDVGARILMQQRQEAAAKAAAEQAVEMDVESDSDEETERIRNEVESGLEEPQQPLKRAPYEVTQPAPMPPSEDSVVIREYDPKKSMPLKKTADKWIISPLTGERIPADKLQEHMRYNTVDSQYKEQREREMSDRNEEEPVYAPGADISTNIGKFAERRTDIFGHGAEQTMIGKKLGEEEEAPRGPDPKLIWDGQQSTIDQTTKLAQQNITLDQQITEIHKQHGYISDPSKERIGPGPAPSQIVQNLATPAASPAATHPPPPPPPPPSTSSSAVPTQPITIRPPTLLVAQATVLRMPVVPVGQMPHISSSARPTIPVTAVPTMSRLQAIASNSSQTPSTHPRLPAFSTISYTSNTPVQMPQIPPLPPASTAHIPQQVNIPIIRPPHGIPVIPLPTMSQGVVPPPRTVALAMPTEMEIVAPPPDADAPPTKKIRTEEELESESSWLEKFPGSIDIRVQTPTVSANQDWKLDGSIVNMSMDIGAPVSTLKSIVQDMTGLPCSKQKLIYEGLFLKDACSLAYYNMKSSSLVLLQIKERGGKKK